MKTVYVAFQNRATGQVGNEGARIRLYRPSNWNFDAALWRTFPLRHNNFGKITSSQNPRIMQAALKVSF